MSWRLFDLAVVGGGVIGLAHAHVAAKAGKRVALIEKEMRANGASIRNFGFVTVTGQERGDNRRLARRTCDIWAEVAVQAGLPIEQRGLYLTARSAKAVAVIEAFLKTEMSEGLSLLAPEAFRHLADGWRVGLSASGNGRALDPESFAALKSAERQARLVRSERALKETGADFVIEDISHLLSVVKEIAKRITAS